MAAKRYRSLEAQYCIEMGLPEFAEEAELKHLNAKGRVRGSNGEVNSCGNVDGARLFALEGKYVIIRVDDSRVPEFWLELFVPIEQFENFVKKAKLPEFTAEEAESKHLKAKGRVLGSKGKVNPYGNVDGAKLFSLEGESVKIRVDDSRVPEFWLELFVPIEQFENFVKKAKVQQQQEQEGEENEHA